MATPHDTARTTALVAALATLIFASVVADRLGAPADVVAILLLGLSIAGVGLAALSSRTMRAAPYMTGARSYGLGRVAVVAAGAGMGLAMLLPAGAGAAALPVLAAGAVIAGGLAGPLHRSGAASLPEFVELRFGSPALAAFTALAAALALAPLLPAAGAAASGAFAGVTGVSAGAAPALTFGFSLVMLAPGGAASLTAALLVVTLLAGAAALAPLAAAEPAAIAATLPALTAPLRADPATAGAGIAAAGLFILLGTAQLARTGRAARRGHVAGGALALALGGAGAAVALAAGGTGEAFIQRLPASLQAVRQFAPALLAAAILALLAHAFVRSLFNDALYRLPAMRGAASGRLALHRLATAGLLAAVIFGRPADLAPLIGTEGLSAAAALAALVTLARWPRADWRAALAGAGAAMLPPALARFDLLPAGAAPLLSAVAVVAAGGMVALALAARPIGGGTAATG